VTDLVGRFSFSALTLLVVTVIVCDCVCDNP